jgi:CRP-like cAMP-binding protein
VTNGFVEGNVEYWIRFFTDRFHMRDGVDSAARDRIWYALSRARIPLAAPNRAVRLQEVSAETQATDAIRDADRRAEALSAVDFLRVLSDDQRRRLAEGSRMHQYGADEAVVRQGDQTAEMFIVQRGEVVVQRENGHGPIEVARLGPGAFFGEMALMTGERRTATVRAGGPCTLIGVDQGALKAVLEASPDLASLISRVIAERQAAAEAKAESAGDQATGVEERSSQLLGRIRKFFAL